MGKSNTNRADVHETILKDTSSTGRERPWRQHKSNALKIADSFDRLCDSSPAYSDLRKRAERMQECGEWLTFGQYVDRETGELTQRLENAHFCRDRMCPMCQWRRSIVQFVTLQKIMTEVREKHPGLVPIFITLTMRNVEGEDLAGALDRLLKGWSRMTAKRYKRKPGRVMVGWFRSLEVTYNAERRDWHPHLHAIGLVSEDYFSDPDKYMKTEDWVAEWRWALQVDYDPVVDVRRIKGEDGKEQDKAVAEVSKYAVKPGEWLSDDEDQTDRCVGLLARVLHRRRLVAYGGLLKEIKADLKAQDAEDKDADLIHTDDSVSTGLLVARDTYSWRWRGRRGDYVLASHVVVATPEDAQADAGGGPPLRE